MQYVGKVDKRRYAPGSKSERIAVVIRTEDGEFLLQRVGGNPFRDDVLESLVGKTIRAEGAERGTSLFISDWEELEE